MYQCSVPDLGIVADPVADMVGVVDQVVVGQSDTLWLARGARSELVGKVGHQKPDYGI